MGSDPSLPLVPPTNSALELDCLGSKPSTATYSSVAFAKLLNFSEFNLTCQVELIYCFPQGYCEDGKKTQGIWHRDSRIVST